LYNHAAIWDDEPELWPRGYYTNGHVLVDAEKMSKSKGNFLMMDETVNEFTVDATRFACADAGDSLDDANFSRETAVAAIMSLSNEESWIRETLAEGADQLRSSGDLNFMDQVLQNETNRLVNATADCFATMRFRDGLQKGWFEMIIARNEYRSWCQDLGITMHEGVLRKWVESLVVAICPVCPHWSENMWKHLGKEGMIVKAPWPTTDEEDKLLTRQAKFLRDALKNFRAQKGKAKKGWKTASILVSDDYPQWKVDILLWMHDQYDANAGCFPKDFMGSLKKWSSTNITDKKFIKLSMQFASWMKKEVEDVGSMAMEIKLPFDQKAIIVDFEGVIKSQLDLSEVEIISLESDAAGSSVPDKISSNVSPGKPYLWFH